MKLLCATDLSPGSDAAIDRACRLRESLGARLTLLHVVPTIGAEIGTLEQRLLSASGRMAQRARHAGEGVEVVVRCGRPATVVIEEARTADLVVIGAQRKSTFADSVRGTLAARVVSETRRPVLVVQRPAKQAYGRVLLALDGSRASGEVVKTVESLGLAEGELAVIHAHEPPYEAMMNTVGVGNLSVASYASASMSQAAETIHSELERHSRHPRRYRVMLVDARPGAAIGRASREMDPELLAIGTRGHGPIRRALLGSTAQEALRAANCDVLLVPEADDPGPMAA